MIMKKDNNIEAFFTIIRAGLWERDARLASACPVDFEQVYRLASQQSVIGLLAEVLEQVADVKAPKEVAMRCMSTVLSLEQRNLAMNAFIADLFQKMEAAGVKALLVKGQGIAQCYERPLWRACGDVDLFLEDSNYEKAKVFLS